MSRHGSNAESSVCSRSDEKQALLRPLHRLDPRCQVWCNKPSISLLWYVKGPTVDQISYLARRSTSELLTLPTKRILKRPSISYCTKWRKHTFTLSRHRLHPLLKRATLSWSRVLPVPMLGVDGSYMSWVMTCKSSLAVLRLLLTYLNSLSVDSVWEIRHGISAGSTLHSYQLRSALNTVISDKPIPVAQTARPWFL